LIPGLKTLTMHIPVIGGFILRQLPSVVETSLSIDISGGVAFGAPKDKVTVTSGQIRLEPNGHVGVGINSLLGGAQIQGNLGGHITLGLNPSKIVSCDIHYSFFAAAGSAKGFVTWPSPPVAHKFFDCDKGLSAALSPPSSLQPSHTDLPPYQVADTSPDATVDAIDMTPVVPPRDGWQPPSFVATTDPATNSTLLVKNATAFIANPAIATRNGVTAVAWIGEDSQKLRPDAFVATVSVERNGQWSKPIVLDDAGPDGHPAIAIDATGNIVVAWDHDGAPAANTLDGTKLMTAVIDPTSLHVSPVPLDLGTGPSGEPQLATSADGHVLLGWRSAESGDKNAFSLGTAAWTGSAWTSPQSIAMPSYPDLWRVATDGKVAAIAAALSEAAEIRVFVDGGSGWAPSTPIGTVARGLALAVSGGKPVLAWGKESQIDLYGPDGLMDSLESTGAPMALSGGDAPSLAYTDAAGTHAAVFMSGKWHVSDALLGAADWETPPALASDGNGHWVSATTVTEAESTPFANVDLVASAPPG
jgi:hypothetical protein